MGQSHFLYDVDQSWTLFLDRDGVLNQRIPGSYVKNIRDFEILPGVLEALYNLKDSFLRMVVVTNQQGVGKGYMTEEDVRIVHEYFLHEARNAHVEIDEIYFSPDLASLPSSTRKPQIGMALQAQRDFPEIDLHKSIMVCDSRSDMEFGRNAGMKTVLVGEKGDQMSTELVDLKVKDLYTFSLLLQSAQSKK